MMEPGKCYRLGSFSLLPNPHFFEPSSFYLLFKELKDIEKKNPSKSFFQKRERFKQKNFNKIKKIFFDMFNKQISLYFSFTN